MRHQDAVATRHQLAELGFGRDHVRRRIGARQWQPWGHGVVILSGAPLSTVQRCRAAVMLGEMADRIEAQEADWYLDIDPEKAVAIAFLFYI